MKYLIFLLFPICLNAQSKLFNGNSITTYSFCFAAGFSDGLNDCVVANKFYYNKFWGYQAWVTRHNIDGYHMSKLGTYVFYSAAITVNVGQPKQNWKYYAGKFLISFASARIGHELCYDVIFKNYPK